MRGAGGGRRRSCWQELAHEEARPGVTLGSGRRPGREAQLHLEQVTVDLLSLGEYPVVGVVGMQRRGASFEPDQFVPLPPNLPAGALGVKRLARELQVVTQLGDGLRGLAVGAGPEPDASAGLHEREVPAHAEQPETRTIEDGALQDGRRLCSSGEGGVQRAAGGRGPGGSEGVRL